MRRLISSPQRQRGVALITVLLVFAIAALVSTKIIVAKLLDVQRSTGLINRTQAYYYALGAEELAILALQEDASEDAESAPASDHLEEFWAQRTAYEVDSFSSLAIQIIDLNRYYNLNNLLQANGEIREYELSRFRDLLVALNIDTDLADNLRDWIDGDDKESGYRSESDAYIEEQPAYMAANQWLSDISELRLVRGFSDEVMDKLAPHVSVLKVEGIVALNINTATAISLSSLQQQATGADSGRYEGLSLALAEDIVSARVEPFGDLAAFNKALSLPRLQQISRNNDGIIPPDRPMKSYRFDSDYYEINIRAEYAGATAYLSTIVRQESSGSKTKFIVLSRRETDNSSRFIQ